MKVINTSNHSSITDFADNKKELIALFNFSTARYFICSLIILLGKKPTYFKLIIYSLYVRLNFEALNFEAEESVLFDFRFMHFTLELLLSASQASSILLGDWHMPFVSWVPPVCFNQLVACSSLRMYSQFLFVVFVGASVWKVGLYYKKS